jgi:competence protein ComEC
VKKLLVLLLAAAGCVDARAEPRVFPHGTELVVRVLDVGQGDAIVIQNGGSTVIVDGGPDRAAFGRRLTELGIDGHTVDAVVLTHAHADHYTGLRALFEPRRRIGVSAFYENGDPSRNGGLASLRGDVARRGREQALALHDADDDCTPDAPACTILMRGGAKVHVLAPDPRGRSVNDRSVAVKIVGPDSASFTMWLAGDAERSENVWFDRVDYDRTPGMRVNVLKANHHGSSDGVSDRYLDLLRPEEAIVSLGAINDYGHMHDETRAIFARHGIPWYRTDQNGTVTIRSPGTPGGGYSIHVERGTTNARGPSDGRRRPWPSSAAGGGAARRAGRP